MDLACRKKKSKDILGQTVDFLKIISEANRLKILCFLRQQEQCVCAIWQFLALPQNLVSHHLKVLKDYGLIGSRKEGTKVFYFLKQKNIKTFFHLLTRIIN
ncbi:hypothetical protein COX69_04095 [Candidatus Falkowbacteria bacterium CG_4_10_14_0_2_um_filter_48_10]|uniref:HTH arsR-type domain-containing protein n=1 Tax=Candidatus Falkowbacteria bacterium CG23_combo_of_CG06-09_8_20_14_all_49_15 TaxID=1974572 RepID=A0A2G9ZJK3_9BACT|nr:MAG: hypothetical protein COX22_04795 [Candidatus Falkowbacteria bacterium CG23_combo_of_CG06-09_8_20_14_all_49_15]PJA07662.1 MAG: hypothetical protein COX69_04095 [Candidatus Falkowbacteria bacterium CG_4_10_14_0_2_um_filter_48_10]